MFMSKSHRIAASAAALAIVASACQASTGDPDPAPSATASSSPTPAATADDSDLAPFESGPESPLGYGLQVPDGATQLGPLTRIRSERLIATYAPDLQAGEAQKAADARAKLAERQAEDPDRHRTHARPPTTVPATTRSTSWRTSHSPTRSSR